MAYGFSCFGVCDSAIIYTVTVGVVTEEVISWQWEAKIRERDWRPSISLMSMLQMTQLSLGPTSTTFQ